MAVEKVRRWVIGSHYISMLSQQILMDNDIEVKDKEGF